MWYNGSTNQTETVFGSGNFYIDIVDTNDCAANDSATVIFNALPTPNLGTDFDVCEDSSVTLDAGVYDSYLWSTGDTTQTIDVDSSATIIVTVFDAFGCSGTDTVVATWRALPVVDLGADTAICNGTSITLDAVNGVMWQWNTLDTTQTLVVDSTGTYSVLATDQFNCTNTDNIFVFVIDSVTVV